MKLLTIEQTAKLLVTSRQTVDRLIADGALPAICLRSGRRKKVWRVREEVLERFLLEREKQSIRDRTKPRLLRAGGENNL